jgi:thiosulfate dehydrogenase [quinone] large subunit
MNKNSFLIVRLAVAASMLGHGLVRLPKLNGFSEWMVSSFEKSMLPSALVTPFSYILPIAEFVIGLLLVIGLFTRISLIAGGFIMVILIFGSAMVENWEAMPSQFIHAAFFAVLLSFLQYNTYAVDNFFKK